MLPDGLPAVTTDITPLYVEKLEWQLTHLGCRICDDTALKVALDVVPPPVVGGGVVPGFVTGVVAVPPVTVPGELGFGFLYSVYPHPVIAPLIKPINNPVNIFIVGFLLR